MQAKSNHVVPGKRMTSQRRLIFDIISDAGGHLDANELFQRSREADPRISLSTVYRNLQLFKQEGLLKERHFAEEHHHYEIKDSTEHCHLICRSCGEVVEIETPLTEEIRATAEAQSQFKVTDIEINMRGVCPECRKMNQD